MRIDIGGRWCGSDVSASDYDIFDKDGVEMEISKVVVSALYFDDDCSHIDIE
jgi:hypothetical protein